MDEGYKEKEQIPISAETSLEWARQNHFILCEAIENNNEAAIDILGKYIDIYKTRKNECDDAVSELDTYLTSPELTAYSRALIHNDKMRLLEVSRGLGVYLTEYQEMLSGNVNKETSEIASFYGEHAEPSIDPQFYENLRTLAHIIKESPGDVAGSIEDYIQEYTDMQANIEKSISQLQSQLTRETPPYARAAIMNDIKLLEQALHTLSEYLRHYATVLKNKVEVAVSS